MAGSLSSLGMGSGTLTADVIDKLKAADESIIIKPIDRKLETNKGQTADLSTLTTLLAGLKASTSSLSGDDMYLKRDTNVFGTSVSATATSGIDIQSIDIDVKATATSSVFQGDKIFTSLEDNIITGGTGNTFEFYLGGAKKTVDLGDGAVSLEKLITEINDQVGSDVTASSINIGNGMYRFVLKSDKEGDANQISFSQNSVSSKNVLDFTSPVTIDKSEFIVNGQEILDENITAYSLDDLVSQLNNAIAKDQNANVTFSADAGKLKVTSLDGKEAFLASPLFSSLTPSEDLTVTNLTGNADFKNVSGDTVRKLTNRNNENDTRFNETITVYDDSGTKVGSMRIEYDIRDNRNNNRIRFYDASDTQISTTGRYENDSYQALYNEGTTRIDSTGMSDENKNLFKAYMNEYSYLVNKDLTENNLGSLATIGEIDTVMASSVKIDAEPTGDPFLDNMGFTALTKAQDARFTFNGVEVTRDTNDVKDLVVGLNLTLETTGQSTIKIDRDDEELKGTLQELVASYNQVLNKLGDLTDFNEESGDAGSFQGVNEVTRIKSSLNRTLLMSDFTQDIHNLVDLGLELNEAGLLTFDESKFNEKLAEDPEAMEKFLKGHTSTVRGKDIEFEGVFTKMNNDLNALIGDNGSLTLYDQNLKSSKDKLEEERQKSLDRLTAKYDTMTNKFAAYDSIISSMTNSFKSLQMQIDALTADK